MTPPTEQDRFLSKPKEIALNGVHEKGWTTDTIRNVACVLFDLADELDFADELLADVLDMGPRL